MRLPLRFTTWLTTAATSAALMTGCSKPAPTAAATPAEAPRPDAAPLVAKNERSAHFAAVTSQLELGGTLFGYMDIDGDVLKLAEGLKNLAEQATAEQPMAAAFIPKDFAPIFADLGFTDVKALGLSSVADGTGGFRNRVYFYTPEGRRGLLAGLGGAPAAFAAPAFAPADTDLVFETELDAPAVYAAIRAVVVRIAGEPMAGFLDAKLDTPDPEAGVAFRDVLTTLKGRTSVVLRVDPARSFEPKPGVVLPAVDLLFRQENGGARLDALLVKLLAASPDDPTKPVREELPGGAVVYRSPTPVPLIDWTPELRIEGEAIVLVSRPDFIASAGASLADDADFRAALARVEGEKGNGLTYIGPRLAEHAARVLTLNPDMPAEQQLAVARVMAMLPEPGRPLVSVRLNLPEGVLLRSYWNASHKQNLVLANPGVVVTTGLMAAMAIPAFQKVRDSSREKAVMNNLRQLEAARDQYFLETGKTTCTYADLVGPGPDKYIRELKPVAGEDYASLTFSLDAPISVRLANGKVVTRAP